MKKPSSSGGGTTGAWKMFSEAYNKVGEDDAEKRRNKFVKFRKSLQESRLNSKRKK